MTKLPILAAQMRAQLETVPKGYIHRVLFGGLHVLLERRDAQWRLAIARLGAVPSRTEAETVAKAFALPAGIEWSWVIKSKKQDRRKLVYKVAECRWIEHLEEPQSWS